MQGTWKKAYSQDRVKEYDRMIYLATMNYEGALKALCQMIFHDRNAPLKILELGAGTGNLTGMLLEKFPQAHVTGVDGSAKMLKAAEIKLKLFADRVRLVRSSFEEYPWQVQKHDSFDLIVSSFALHHLDHRAYEGIFKQFFRILNNSGQLVVADFTLSEYPALQFRYEDIWVETRTVQMSKAFGMPLNKEQVWAEHQATKDAEGDNPAPLSKLLACLTSTGFEEAECYWKHFCYSVYGARKFNDK